MRSLAAVAFAVVLGATAHANQFIVSLVSGSDPATVAARNGLTLLDTAPGSPFVLLDDPAGDPFGTVQSRLLADPAVQWAEDNAEISETEGQNGKGSTVPVVRTTPFTFAANRIANQAISDQLKFPIPKEVTGFSKAPRIRVAILDNGLSPNQTSLWSKVDVADASFKDPAGYYDMPVGVDWNGDGYADNAVGHGTMVAGLVLTYAPNARLVVVKVSNSDGLSNAWRITKGLAIAAKNKARVVALALGSQTAVPAMTNVAEWADLQGMTLVAPAGNQNLNLCMSPARARSVIAVTSVESNNVKSAWANYDGSIDVAVPTTNISSAWYSGGSASWSGTSFAVPVTAAAVADLLAIKPTTTPGAVLQAITRSGLNIDAQNPAYRGKLGVLLQVSAFWSAVR